ncbi:MAG: sensor histidine kinase, partial [Pseudomonadota bacterium]
MTSEATPLRWRDSLSIKLLALTIGIILLVELFIFIPSAVSRRDQWIDDRVQAARIAALALEAAPSQTVSNELSAQLLANAEVLTVAEIGGGIRQLLLAPDEPVRGDMLTIDRTTENYLARLNHTAGTAFRGAELTLRVIDRSNEDGYMIEILLPEKPLRQDLADFSHRILGLSLLISVTAGALLYFLLSLIVVRPVQRVTESILQFRNDPSATPISRKPSTRRDEIGRAQNALTDMETAVSD